MWMRSVFALGPRIWSFSTSKGVGISRRYLKIGIGDVRTDPLEIRLRYMVYHAEFDHFWLNGRSVPMCICRENSDLASIRSSSLKVIGGAR